jgi:hypothetical protein
MTDNHRELEAEYIDMTLRRDQTVAELHFMTAEGSLCLRVPRAQICRIYKKIERKRSEYPDLFAGLVWK